MWDRCRVNNDGVIFIQVRGQPADRNSDRLDWLFKWTEIDAIEAILQDFLCLVLIAASRKSEVNFGIALSCEIAQAKILFAARLLIDGGAPSSFAALCFRIVL